MYYRHYGDSVRQQDLAKKRVNVRSTRLIHNDMYERKVDKTPDPQHGQYPRNTFMSEELRNPVKMSHFCEPKLIEKQT